MNFASSVVFSHNRKAKTTHGARDAHVTVLVVGIQVVDSVLLCCDCQTSREPICHCWCSNIGSLVRRFQSRRYGRSGRQHQRPHPLNM